MAGVWVFGRQNTDIAGTLHLRDVAMAIIFWLSIYGMHIGATWRIRLNCLCAAVMRPYVKLLWPLVGTLEAPWPWRWPWIRSSSHRCAYVVEVYPHTNLDANQKNFVDVRTARRTDTPNFSKSVRSSPGNDLFDIVCSEGGHWALGFVSAILHLDLLATHDTNKFVTDHFSGPGWALGPVCVFTCGLVYEITFGLDIWHPGLLLTSGTKVKVTGHSQGRKMLLKWLRAL